MSGDVQFLRQSHRRQQIERNIRPQRIIEESLNAFALLLGNRVYPLRLLTFCCKSDPCDQLHFSSADQRKKKRVNRKTLEIGMYNHPNNFALLDQKNELPSFCSFN